MRSFIALLIVLALGAGGYWAYERYGLPDFVHTAGVQDQAPGAADLAYFEALPDTPPAAPAAGEAEFRAFADALKGVATVEFGSIETGTEGATAHDVVIKSVKFPALGARIGELRLWGANPDAGRALAGDAGADGAIAAARIDARDVKWLGLEELAQPALDAYGDLLSEGAAAAGAPLDFSQKIHSYDLHVDRIVMDGLRFFPLDPADPSKDAADHAGGAADLLAALRSAARVARAYGFNAAGVYGMTGQMDMEEMGASYEMTMSLPLSGYRGAHRGDSDLMISRDLSYKMNMSMPLSIPDEEVAENGEPDATPPMVMNFSGEVALTSVTGLKLAKALGYLAAGKLPPTSETNLMSLGVWRVKGERIMLNDAPVYSIGESYADFSHFHWLAPTDVHFRIDDLVYNIEGYQDLFKTMAVQQGGAEAAAGEQFDKVIAVLKKHGLAAPSFDFDMQGHWSPETGAASSAFTADADGLGGLEMHDDAQFATFDEIAPFMPAEGKPFDSAGLMTLLQDKLALRSASIAMSDAGGIAKSFAAAVDMADLSPDGAGGMAMLKGADPADIRVAAASSIRLMAGQAGQQFPPATDYLKAFGNYIQYGGVLRADAAPPEPVTLKALEAATQGESADPQALVDLLGLTVTHEPPAESGK